MEKRREFPTGANRDIGKGKIQYIYFTHPLLEHSFGEYMMKNQYLPDGTIRSGDNWWAGWDKAISLDSLQRHVMDLRAIEAGYRVYKTRIVDLDTNETEEQTLYTKKNKDDLPGYVEVTAEDCCNAVRFNAGAYLLQELK